VLLLIFPGWLARPCADFAFIGVFWGLLLLHFGLGGNVYKNLAPARGAIFI